MNKNKNKHKKPIKFLDVLFTILSYTWVILSVAIVLFPVLWMISASFTQGKLLSGVPVFPDPSKFTLEHYQYLFTYKSSTSAQFSDFVGAFVRTLMIAGLNTVLVVFLSTLTGYAVSRFKFKSKKKLLLTLMALQMFPSFMGMLAIFLLFRMFGLLNNPLALVLIYATGAVPYNTFIIRGFMRNIPKSLDEAAMIDGATNVQTMRHVIFPLIVPIIGFIAVNAFMAPWLDYILQSQLLQGENITVAVWLYRTTDVYNSMYYNPLNFMAGALIIAIPIMLVNLYMQKYVMYGLTSGAEKG